MNTLRKIVYGALIVGATLSYKPLLNETVLNKKMDNMNHDRIELVNKINSYNPNEEIKSLDAKIRYQIKSIENLEPEKFDEAQKATYSLNQFPVVPETDNKNITDHAMELAYSFHNNTIKIDSLREEYSEYKTMKEELKSFDAKKDSVCNHDKQNTFTYKINQIMNYFK